MDFFVASSIQESLPLYSVFLLILVISSGFLTAFFPCRLQNALNDNIYLKHASGFMTMLFFIVLTIPDYDKKIFEVIPKTCLLYAFFLILIKTDFPFFIAILVVISVIYILVLRRSELRDELKEYNNGNNNGNNKNNKGNMDNKNPNPGAGAGADSAKITETQHEYNTIVTINNALTISIIPLLVVGCLVYLGKKRYKYKNKFSIITFIFGAFKCKSKTTNVMTIGESLRHVF